MNQMLSKSGNQFIDDNPHDLLDHLVSLESALPQGMEKAFQRFLGDMENHFHHEETILKGAGYEDLSSHTLEHRRIAIYFHELLNDSGKIRDVDSVVTAIKTRVFEHELTVDQDFWDLFPTDAEKEPLLRWEPSLETGIEDFDAHHRALARHINRFYLDVSHHQSRKSVLSELNVLRAYAGYHFASEEQSIASDPQHKANHAQLLSDLDRLMQEFAEGKHTTESLRDYFDYWLFNHIRVHDIPAANGSNPDKEN